MSRLRGPLLSVATLAVLLLPLEWWLRREFDHRHAPLWNHVAGPWRADEQPRRFVWPAGLPLQLVDIIQVAPWRDLVYQLRPLVQGEFHSVSYRSNSHGMRGPETPQKKPVGAFRIAVLGDSIAFGWGVEVEQRFSDVLQELLTAAAPGHAVEVLNFGVPGYNTALEAACLERTAMAFEPDLVLVQYLHNDRSLPTFLLGEPPRPTVYIWDWLVQRLGLAADDASVDTVLQPQDELEAAWRRDAALVPPELAYMVGLPGVERALGRIIELTRAAGIPAVILLDAVKGLPVLDPDEASERVAEDAQVMEIAERLGFSTLGTHGPMLRWIREHRTTATDLIVAPLDWHPNATWHALAAQVIADHVLPLLPPGPR